MHVAYNPMVIEYLYNARMSSEIKQLVEEVVVTRQARAAMVIVVEMAVVTRPTMGMPITVPTPPTPPTQPTPTVPTTMVVADTTAFTTRLVPTLHLTMTATTPGTIQTVKSCTVLSDSVGLQSLVLLSPEV
jgi:hypothetical protein